MYIQDATAKLATGGNTLWSGPLSALTHGLRNLGLSYFAQSELLALEGELEAWHGAAPLVSQCRLLGMQHNSGLKISKCVMAAMLGVLIVSIVCISTPSCRNQRKAKP